MEASGDDLRHNFELERRLAGRLRDASAPERLALYGQVYDEYFREARNVGHTVDDVRETARQVRLVTRFLPRGGRYLEIGAGTCHVAGQIIRWASAVYAVEVSAEVVPTDVGVTVVLSDGVAIPLPPVSIDLAFANQVIEHLHPDDVRQQMRNVGAVLVDGGKYVCVTPNRLTGPHDVSKYFSAVAVGFHLREYTIRELCVLLLAAGFTDVRVCVAVGGEVLVAVPGHLYAMFEGLLARLPRRARRSRLVRKFLDPGAVVATK
jgi:SAM-dependent methyltransferase